MFRGKTLLKYTINKYKNELILLIFFLFAVILVVKSSGAPYALPWGENIFKQFQYNNDIALNLGLGYITSLIFYLIVVYAPDRKKRNDVNDYISYLFPQVVSRLKSMYCDISKASGLNYKFEDLNEYKIIEICTSANPKENYGYLRPANSMPIQTTLGTNVKNSYLLSIQKINEIMVYLPLLDTKLVMLLNSVFKSELNLVIDSIDDTAVSNINLSAWSSSFVKFFVIVNKLSDYQKHEFI